MNIFARALIAFLLSLYTLPASAMATPRETPPVIIAYLPTFKGNMPAHLDSIDLSKLTHIDIAFINPDPQGRIVAGDALACGVKSLMGPPPSLGDIRAVVSRAHAAGVKVLASMGGGTIPLCAGDWSALLAPDMRPALEANLLKFVDDFDLDGLDIDLEWEVLTRIDKAGDYTPFADELSAALHRRGKLLTCATASHEGGMVPVAAIPAFDYIGIMSYDAIGPGWGTPGDEHASLQSARDDIATWQARGAKKRQIVLGVPFYGHGFGDDAGGYDYKDIITKFGAPATENDVVGQLCAGCSYITYNGRPTIRAKAELAHQSGAGVMIWEITGDAAAPDSLLDALADSLGDQGAPAQ